MTEQKSAVRDIFLLLVKDHEEVKSLFSKLKSGQPEKSIFKELDQELTIHMEAEEKHFYARLKEFDETRDLIVDGYEEHNEARELLKELNELSFGTEEWELMFGDLQQRIEHHVEEEEDELFEKARSVLEQEETDMMARAFELEKEVRLKKAG